MLPVAVPTQGAGPWRPPAETRSWTDRSGTICDTDATTATGGGRSLRAGLFLPAPLGFLPTPWWLAPDSHQARCHHGHCLRFDSRLTSSSVPPPRVAVAGPRAFTVSPVTTF